MSLRLQWWSRLESNDSCHWIYHRTSPIFCREFHELARIFFFNPRKSGNTALPKEHRDDVAHGASVRG